MQSLSPVDAVALVHNITNAVGNRVDQIIATSHSILLQRIAKQDEALAKQQEMLQALSDKVMTMQQIQEMQSQIQHLINGTKDGLNGFTSATIPILEDLRESVNQRLSTIQDRLKEMQATSCHLQGNDDAVHREDTVDTSLPRDVSFQSPATVKDQQWKRGSSTSNHVDDVDDLRDLYEEFEGGAPAYDIPTCVNPLDTIRSRASKSPQHLKRALEPEDSGSGTTTPSLPDPSSLLTERPRPRKPILPGSSPLTQIFSDIDTSDNERHAQGDQVRVRRSPKAAAVIPEKSLSQPLRRPRGRPVKHRPVDDSQLQTIKKRKDPASTSTGNSDASSSKPRTTKRSRTSIWPKLDKSNANSHQFIQCDKCSLWYHWACVGVVEGDIRLKGDHEFACPPCSTNSGNYKPNTPTLTLRPVEEPCSRPNCLVISTSREEYFVERLVGRFDRKVSGRRRYSWLVKWEGYSMKECNWIPGNEIDVSRTLVDTFEREAHSQGAIVHDKPLVLLKEAIEAGWDKRVK